MSLEIEIKNLSKNYGKKQALDHVNLTIKKNCGISAAGFFHVSEYDRV